MRTLSIRQPYIEAILGRADDGKSVGKRVENRSGWAGCNIRGPFLLHASKTCTKAAFAEGVAFIQDVLKAEGRTVTVPPLADLPQGGLVGMARLVGVEEHPVAWTLDGSPIDAAALEERPRGCAACEAEGCDACGGSGIAGGWCTSKGWAIGGALGLQLADAHALPFVPWKGSRNFFEVPLRSLPAAYHAAAQVLEDAERSRLALSRDERRLLEAACGNGSGHPEDRRPGLLAVRCHVDEVASALRGRGLLKRLRRIGGHVLHQVTVDGRRALGGHR